MLKEFDSLIVFESFKKFKKILTKWKMRESVSISTFPEEYFQIFLKIPFFYFENFKKFSKFLTVRMSAFLGPISCPPPGLYQYLNLSKIFPPLATVGIFALQMTQA